MSDRGSEPAGGGLLEVRCLHAPDAERAEAGGADRVELVGRTEHGGLSPEPELVDQVCRATSLPVRVVLRLREGLGTDGGEVAHLQGLASNYAQAGAEGLVLGFLNGHTDVDEEVVPAILGAVPPLPWTFSRAVDACISTDRAWRSLRRLPGLDAVLTAGSARTVAEGLDDLVTRAQADEFARRVIVAAGGLQPEHVPWLARAGIRGFHIAAAARPLGSLKAYVDPDLVHAWRTLIDDAAARATRT